jgi:hypothetical protein
MAILIDQRVVPREKIEKGTASRDITYVIDTCTGEEEDPNEDPPCVITTDTKDAA